MFGRSLFPTLLLILNNFVHMSKGRIKPLFTKIHKDMKLVGLQYSQSTLQHTLEKYLPVPIWREKFQKYGKFCVQEHFGYLAPAIILGVYSSARNIIFATKWRFL